MPLFQAICPGCLWARDNMWLLSRVQQLAGPAGGQGAFVPGGATNPFYPGWWIHLGQKAPRLFYPDWSHQPGQKAPLLSRLVASPGTKGPTIFIPVGNTNPDKRVTLLSRLVVPTRTKGPST